MTTTIYWKYFSLKNEKILFYFFLSILFISYKSTAQNNFTLNAEQFYKTISFGEKIDFGNLDSAISWTITNSKNNTSANLRGNEINDYQFQEPGIYNIDFYENVKHDDECNHAVFAPHFSVKVEPVKMTFDFSKISFSEKIEKGRNYSDLIISVPVEITSKDNTITKLPAPGMSVAGIGVGLVAEPVQKEVMLNKKTQILKYKVSGMVKSETYLMFDFYDFNNQVQTYNLRQIIK